jgi:peptide/nickel transport system substrate-binding protein
MVRTVSRHALLVTVLVLSLGVPSMVLSLNMPLAAQAPDCTSTGGAIVAAMSTNPPTLDPMLSTTTASRQVAVYIFESLVAFDENYAVIPQLAAGWTTASNGLVYTFKLRPGVKFHNGQTVTAPDVKASFDRYLKAAPGASGRFASLKSVTVVDDLTLRFELAKDFPLLPNLAMPTPLFGVFPKTIIDKYGEREIREQDLVGTGPYRFAEWRPDVAVRLSRFADYRPDTRFPGPTGFGGRRVACADHIGLIPVTEAGSRVAGLLTGTYDFVEAVPITSVPQLEANKDINVEIVKPKWGILVELNHGETPMTKLPFRKALVAALNMGQIMAATSFGNRPEYVRLSPSIFFPEQKDWHTTAGSAMYNKPDMDQVKRLLSEAGYNNEPIVYLTNQNYDWMYKASLAMASQWQRAGINIKIELMDWPSQIQKAQSLRGWHINQTGWSPRFDPLQTIVSLRCGSRAAYNYCNREMDRLLDQVNTDLPFKERQAVWTKIQQMVWDDVAVIRIGDYFEPEAIRSSLKGYKPFYVIPRFWNVSKVR